MGSRERVAPLNSANLRPRVTLLMLAISLFFLPSLYNACGGVLTNNFPSDDENSGGVPPEGLTISVRIQWNKNSEPDCAGYRIFWGKASGSYENSLDIPGAANLQVEIKELAVAQTYFFALKAYDAAGNFSDLSSEVQFSG